MTIEDKKIESKPNIRFEGFTDAWEQRKVGDICSISTGKSNTQDKIDDGEYPFYVRSPVIEHSNKYLYDEEAVLTVGDGVGTGKVFHYVNGKYDLHQRVYRMFGFSEDVMAKYFYYYFSNHFYQRVMQMTAKTSVDSVRYEMIADMDIELPSVKEQGQIASVFTTLDHLITLHQHKCDRLIALKKAYLDKMFPKDGETMPELRFEGFTDAWEQRKLNEITDVRDGTHDSPKYVKEGHPFITSKNVSNGFINYDDVQYVTDEDYEKINKRSKVDIHDILMGMIGTIGNLALIRRNPDFAIKNVALIKHTGDIDYQYLYQVLQADCVTSQLSTGMDGGTQKFVSLKKIRELDIPFPEELEQQKIGTYFSILDNLITLHQRKCERLKHLKQAYLEKMFI